VMTPRQRVEAVLRRELPDKTPFTIYESKLPQCSVERRLRDDGLCIVDRRVPVVTERTPNVSSEARHYQEDGVAYVRRVIRTPVGDLTALERPAGFTSWQLERLFQRPEDYRPLLFMIQDTRYEPCYEEFLKAQAWKGEDVILRARIGLTPLHQIMIGWMGVETFAVEWLERRDEVLKLYHALADQHRRLFPLIAQSPALHANYGGNETADVMGKERFERYVVPLYNEAADVFHRHGKLLGAHLDGNNRLWAQAVAESGLDYVEAFTPAPDCDMTLAEAMAAWPEKVLWINFPSSVHLASIETIEQTARELIETAAPGSRFILGITEDVPEDRWQQNLLAISRIIDETAAAGG
jgi:uroporphyrinogen decarboxylase-like protein